MPKSIIGGWRALSLLTQADIRTAKPVNTLFNFEGEPLEPEPETQYVNDTEITGELLPTKHRLLNKKFTGTHASKAFPHVVACFASMAMGKDTPTVVGTTTAYRHKIEIDKSIVELPYRTMVENDGDQQYQFVGVTCVGWKLSGKRGDFVEFSADLVGTGAEAADVTAKPARVNESYLAYCDAKLNKGGVFDGTAVTGGTDISAPLVDFELTFKNNGKGVYLFGDASGEVGQTRRGNKYEVTFDATIEIEDRQLRADLLAGTEFAIDLPIVGGVANGVAKYTIEPILPCVFVREAKKGVDDGILNLKAKFGVQSHPTYGGLILNVINLQSASYLAAA